MISWPGGMGVKELTKDILFSVFAGLVLPGFILNGASRVWNKALQTREEGIGEQIISAPLPVKIRRADGTVSEDDMDTYLVGVVLGEMPAYFEPEALKAQAVVARTYARKAWLTGGKHGDGSICTEPSCCQAWVDEQTFDQEAVENVRQAVQRTSGQVLTFDGELIEATYFSCSGGRTEDAVAVWGTEVPYLQAVDSPGEENAAHYRDTVTFSAEELRALLELADPEFRIGDIVHTDGGGIDTLEIGGKMFTGTELREKLGLYSAAFSIEREGDLVTVITKGYGHRVGMSQYGADAMAAAGSGYPEILAHYYPGTQLTQLSGK